MTEREQIDSLIAQPELLLLKKPFTRGTRAVYNRTKLEVDVAGNVVARLPKMKRIAIAQEQFGEEFDVNSHKCLTDENIPCVTIKNKKHGVIEMEQYRVAIPFQKIIMEKQARHLTVNPMLHSLLNTDPTETQKKQFVRIKEEWKSRNMDGKKSEFVRNQKTWGDAALLFYMDENKRVNARNICFDDGYTIITHKNQNGKHILECLYYESDGIEYIDCYDDEYFTRLQNTVSVIPGGGLHSTWSVTERTPHGFSENPLITHRGDVAWNEGQLGIEAYEVMYNTFLVNQKKHGWGVLYVKGKFSEKAKRIAGNVVLNDTSMDPNADAKFLNPDDPQHMIDVLDSIEHAIQKATGTTFILPKDINLSGDVSGLAVELTTELDMATAEHGVTEWQNASNKMMRLFKEGLAIEFVSNHEAGFEHAITDFAMLRITSELSIWKPKSEEGHNQMVSTAYGAGIISLQTAVEKNTLSNPDELMRIKKEKEEEAKELALENAKKVEENVVVTE
jgi:hypothetical protein